MFAAAIVAVVIFRHTVGRVRLAGCVGLALVPVLLFAFGRAGNHPMPWSSHHSSSSSSGSNNGAGSGAAAAPQGNATSDVTIDACYAFASNPKADVFVTNHTGSTASYEFSVTFDSPDGSEHYSTDQASATDLAPGATTKVTVEAAQSSGTNAQGGTNDFVCHLTEANHS